MFEAARSRFDHNQNFWQLASITGMALGLPAMVVGGMLADEYGAGTAVISICIGNILLWLIGLGIISMTEGRSHAIENIKDYLGKTSSIIAALIWILAFLIWYVIQIEGTTEVVGKIVPHARQWQIGVVLGVFCASLSIGGIQLIKRICTLALPLVLCGAVYAIATSHQIVSFKDTWGISFPAILSVLLIWMPGTVNLPTLFRHSKSRDDSILGLCLMAGLHTFFQIFTVLIGMNSPIGIVSNYTNNSEITFGLVLIVCLVVLSFLCINLVNIYFASAGWEAAIFRHTSSKQYVVVGLIGTAVYFCLNVLVPFSSYVRLLEINLTSFIVSLGVVLVIDFLIRTIVKHRPRPLKKFWSSICWLIGCLASLLAQTQGFSGAMNASEYSNSPVIVGVLASCLAFLIVIFFEETFWAIKALPKNA